MWPQLPSQRSGPPHCGRVVIALAPPCTVESEMRISNLLGALVIGGACIYGAAHSNDYFPQSPCDKLEARLASMSDRMDNGEYVNQDAFGDTGTAYMIQCPTRWKAT